MRPPSRQRQLLLRQPSADAAGEAAGLQLLLALRAAGTEREGQSATRQWPAGQREQAQCAACTTQAQFPFSEAAVAQLADLDSQGHVSQMVSGGPAPRGRGAKGFAAAVVATLDVAGAGRKAGSSGSSGCRRACPERQLLQKHGTAAAVRAHWQ